MRRRDTFENVRTFLGIAAVVAFCNFAPAVWVGVAVVVVGGGVWLHDSVYGD